MSANLDGQTASNVEAAPSFAPKAGVEVHGYNNQFWRSSVQANNAQVTGGVDLTADAAGSLTSGIDNNSTNVAAPTYGGVLLNAH